jgi:hypothetical protein
MHLRGCMAAREIVTGVTMSSALKKYEIRVC